MLDLKKWMTKVSNRLNALGVYEESVTDTTSSTGWILLKHNNANIQAANYEVVSAYESTNRIVIPFVSGTIWYAKVLEYSNMSVVSNSSVTVYYTLRKVGGGTA